MAEAHFFSKLLNRNKVLYFIIFKIQTFNIIEPFQVWWNVAVFTMRFWIKVCGQWTRHMEVMMISKIKCLYFPRGPLARDSFIPASQHSVFNWRIWVTFSPKTISLLFQSGRSAQGKSIASKHFIGSKNPNSLRVGGIEDQQLASMPSHAGRRSLMIKLLLNSIWISEKCYSLGGINYGDRPVSPESVVQMILFCSHVSAKYTNFWIYFLYDVDVIILNINIS